MVVAGSVLLHATVLLALELLCVVSTGRNVWTRVHTHLRCGTTPLYKRRASLANDSTVVSTRFRGNMFDLDAPPQQCAGYNAAHPASSHRRCFEDSMRQGKTCFHKANQNQCPGNRQIFEDCSAFLIELSLAESSIKSHEIMTEQDAAKI